MRAGAVLGDGRPSVLQFLQLFATHMSKSTVIYIVSANAGYVSQMLHMFRQCCIFFANAMTPCLGHLAWEILPGAMGLGPWAQARSPRQDLPGKVSQAYINTDWTHIMVLDLSR